jgi:very-short-patch-repair endonuclease
MAWRHPEVCIEGVSCADPADTAIDISLAAAPIDVLPVLDAALRAGIDQAALNDALARAAGMRGVLEVRRQLPDAMPAAESPMESRARYRILEARLPAPELQISVDVAGGRLRRLDMGWRSARVGLEFDGQDFHSGDGSLDRDRRRSAELLAAGWTVLSITGSDVYQHPERFTGVLRTLLRDKRS